MSSDILYIYHITEFLCQVPIFRISEYFSLHVDKDVDLKNGIARIVNNHIRINGKSYDRAVKTRESERTISIKGFLAEELKEIKSWSSGRIEKYVCEHNGKLPDPTHISRALKAFQEANGLPVCRFHDLRHTFAMLQIEQGTDLDTLKRLLGHSKISITSDLYLHENINLIEKPSTSLEPVFYETEERKNRENRNVTFLHFFAVYI